MTKVEDSIRALQYAWFMKAVFLESEVCAWSPQPGTIKRTGQAVHSSLITGMSNTATPVFSLSNWTISWVWLNLRSWNDGEVWGSMGKYGEHDDTLNIHLMNQRFFFVLFWLSSLTIPEDLSHCCWDSGETTWSLIMQWSVHLHVSIWISFHQCSIGCQTYQSYSAMVDFNCLSKQGLASGYMSEIWRHPDLATFRGLDAKQSCLFRLCATCAPFALVAIWYARMHSHQLRYAAQQKFVRLRNWNQPWFLDVF